MDTTETVPNFYFPIQFVK